jgi:hypothetical protein
MTDETAATAPADAAAHKSAADRMAAARAARKAKAAASAHESPAAPTQATPAPAEAVVHEPSLSDELPAGPTILERAAANQEEQRQAKIAALRAAKLNGPDAATEPMVQVRVLKRGAGLISMGDHIGGLGDLTYDAGETPSFPRSIAQALEDRGLVEI